MTDAAKARTAALRHARADILRGALPTVPRRVPHDDVEETKALLDQLRKDHVDLDRGRGVYAGTEAARAIEDLADATRELGGAQWKADHADRWRDRRAGSRDTELWTQRKVDAEQRWVSHVAPAAMQLDDRITVLESELADLEARESRDVTRYMEAVGLAGERAQDTQRLGRQVSRYRDQLDGVQRQKPRHIPAPKVLGGPLAPVVEAPSPRLEIGM